MKNKLLIGGTLVVSAVFFIVWWLLFAGNDNTRMWYAFLVNFLFFTSVSGGLVVWPAIIVSTYGNWMGGVEKYCWTGLFYSVPSIVALVVLWLSSQLWAPWIENDKGMFWLNNNFLFIRNFIALSVFWIMGFLFAKNRYAENRRVYARLLVVAYVIAFSLLGFDFVMTLKPEWYTMMIGGYFFSTGVYVAAAVWALMAVISGVTDKKTLQDIGKLIIAFCMFSSYLMFSHLFPIWYENIPEEIIFLIPRMNYSWKWISYLLLFLVYLGPIAFLLPAYTKRHPKILGTIAFFIIIGLWIERWWLVYAVFDKDNLLYGLPEIVSTLAFLALTAGGMLLGLKIIPGYLNKRKQLQQENRSYEIQ